MELRAKVLTVSDAASAGERDDISGPALVELLRESGFEVVDHRIVNDGVAPVATALREMAGGFAGLLVTTGGTGFSPRDLTPEATLQVLEREAPGMSEAMRATSEFGPLSRGRAGTLGRCVIVNTPGSPRGACESLRALLGVLAHAIELLAGEGAQHPPETGGSTATSS